MVHKLYKTKTAVRSNNLSNIGITVPNFAPDSPSIDKFISVNGINITYTIDNNGIVVLKPTKSEIKQILNASTDGKILFNFDTIDDISIIGAIIEFNPVWFNQAEFNTISFMIEDAGGITVSSDMLNKLGKLNKTLQFNIQKSSLIFDIVTASDGKSIDWYDYENPILISIPVSGANYIVYRCNYIIQ